MTAAVESAERLTEEKRAEILAHHQAMRPGPYAWQRAGGEVHLMEQRTGNRYVVLSTVPMLDLLDRHRVLAACTDGVLHPLTPDHPDAVGLAASWQDIEDLLKENAALEATLRRDRDAKSLAEEYIRDLEERMAGMADLELIDGIVREFLTNAKYAGASLLGTQGFNTYFGLMKEVRAEAAKRAAGQAGEGVGPNG
ncbi:MAG TPA: hypothetical protein VGK74_22425 [Symbiobacteriaceae bacterium]|jgi:cellulose biosynthesis protein BcsQ